MIVAPKTNRTHLTSETFTEVPLNLIKKLYQANIDYARRSIMTGDTHNGTPVTGGKVHSSIYTATPSDSYLQFDLHRPALLNFISFHLFDHDDRTYTYSIDLLTNGQWETVISNRTGLGIQYINFPEVDNVTSIRIKGKNTKNPYLHLLNDHLSFRYDLSYVHGINL